MGKHILIIDDDDDLVEALMIILEAKNYNVTRSSNGKEGIESLKHHIPDLIVLDIMMDSMDEGINIAREIKRQEQWKHIPIIGMSAINNEFPCEIDSDNEMFPVDSFLEKPVSPGTFIAEIEKLIKA
jgi:CheY-like chemotaxis protein